MITRFLAKLPRVGGRVKGCCYSTSVACDELPQRKGPMIDYAAYRTDESNVASHTQLHLAKYYTIPPEEKKQLFLHGGFPKQYEMQVKTFGESCLMVREPAIELLNYIRGTDFDRPVVRYVLYGENGTGKTLVMAHVLHYAMQNGFLLVHIPWVPNWMKRPKEVTNSASQEGLIDLPFDAATWLKHFKHQNGHLLKNLDLKTSEDYQWSQRELTPAGSMLSELIEHGISRVKFASDTIEALLSEIKRLAAAKQCKVMVAIDGFNAFFHPETRVLTDNKVRVPPNQLTVTKPFLDITSYDWTNGVCVLTVDKIAMTENYMESYLPRYLLGKWGFEHLDPFVPVLVNGYNEREYHSCINYYLDRGWIQKTPDGFDHQLKYLSACNPYRLMQMTRSL